MKWLGNMTTKELGDIAIELELIRIDTMYDDMQQEASDNTIPAHLVQGDINNSEEWEMVKRTGNNDLYPLSRAIFRNVHTGELVNGMWDEQSGNKLIGEIIQ